MQSPPKAIPRTRSPPKRRTLRRSHPAVHARRPVAGRHLRLQADDRQARRRAPRLRQSQVAAQHQDGPDALTVRFQAVRRVRQVGQRHLSGDRQVRRRHHLRPLDAHRHPRARRGHPDDEPRRTCSRTARAWARGSPTASARRPRICRGLSPCRRVAQPRGKLANWGNAFLPGAYAGTYVNIGRK